MSGRASSFARLVDLNRRIKMGDRPSGEPVAFGEVKEELQRLEDHVRGELTGARRIGRIAVDVSLVELAFRLPPDCHIVDAGITHSAFVADESNVDALAEKPDTLVLTVTGPQMPQVAQGALIPYVQAVYESVDLASGGTGFRLAELNDKPCEYEQPDTGFVGLEAPPALLSREEAEGLILAEGVYRGGAMAVAARSGAEKLRQFYRNEIPKAEAPKAEVVGG